MLDASSLILTLRLDDAAFARFEHERRRYFPPSRNVVPAHLTLFHKLPGDHIRDVVEDILDVTSRSGSLRLVVPSIRFLGTGVAYDIDSAELRILRDQLAQRWSTHLSRQDRQRFRPHVTIQNKVASDTARMLFDRLKCEFNPFEIEGTGLQLWHYRGGPWEWAGEHAFAGDCGSLQPGRVHQ